MICMCLTRKTLKDNLADAAVFNKYVDCLELRADLLDESELPQLAYFPERTGKPCILTLRKTADGGSFSGGESEHSKILGQGLEGPYAYVDIEHDTSAVGLIPQARQKGIQVIRSYHNLEEVPGNIKYIIDSIASADCDVPKAACRVGSIRQLYNLTKANMEYSGKPAIILGMGPFGFATRVLAPKFGNFLTFCSPPDTSAAPGHIDPVKINDVYRYKSINSNTGVFAVTGNPVMHSKSPDIHNPGLEKAGLDAVYIPVQADDLAAFLEYCKLLGITGVSVTVPHKHSAMESMDNAGHEAVTAIQACNTLVMKNNKWTGYNTDAAGCIAPLSRLFGHYAGLQGKKATVVGAGGAAKAVLFALKKAGVEILIINRTAAKATQIGEQFNVRSAPAKDTGWALMRDYSDIIIQTTPAGMHPNEDIDPLENYSFTGSETVYDLIYAPEKTKMLARAEKAGCRILNGKAMLVYQALEQFKLFTGKDYPLDPATCIKNL